MEDVDVAVVDTTMITMIMIITAVKRKMRNIAVAKSIQDVGVLINKTQCVKFKYIFKHFYIKLFFDN